MKDTAPRNSRGELPLPDLRTLPGQRATRRLMREAVCRLADVDSEHLSIGDQVVINMIYSIARGACERHGRG